MYAPPHCRDHYNLAPYFVVVTTVRGAVECRHEAESPSLLLPC